MFNLAEAQNRILGALTVLPAERVPLPEALHRVLAEAVTADGDFPPFARSRRDGFALRAADTAPAATRPVGLRVLETVAAGHPAAMTVTPGTAARILTGAPVPAGADSVAADEEGERRDNVFRLDKAVPAGQYIEPAGKEYRQGELLLPAGTVLSPGALALCAAVGLAAAPIIRRPVVGILATGDELAGKNRTRQPGQIRDSNSTLAAAAVKQWGGKPMVFGPAPDNPAMIAEQLRAGLAAADMMVTTGGTADGDCDCLPEALARLGAGYLFRRVAMRPGTGTHAAIWEGKLICALSGNPGALAAAAELLVRPALYRLAGRRRPGRPEVTARLNEKWHLHSPLPHYLPVCVGRAGGEYRVGLGSPGMLSLARMNGLAVAAGGPRTLAAGETVRVMLTGEVEE